MLHENNTSDKLRLIPNSKVLWSFGVLKVVDHNCSLMLPSCTKQRHFHHTSSFPVTLGDDPSAQL